MTWTSDDWRWRLMKRGRVQHMYAPWMSSGKERTYRRRCDSTAVVGEFKKSDNKTGKCKRCQQYV